ncbi:LysR family transcriptional regulator [Parahaliea maris]|uniref:LysR family transcriptional regulator n=1 Tax=Parahaliea maris TaxID=2716870 RepID=A0A5C9A584_9GAMM|nr:LysR substrate-binding domain-containing protein [Parahaliea maris]TXS96043.1 LysR family transcriptional regulator [Parahaliea maris]
MHNFEAIEAFVSVVDHQSFARAAEGLGVSRSHVSKLIAALESRLGAQLLVRTTRKLSVTEVGQAFFLRCQDVLRTLREAEEAVQDLQETPRGRLRITVAGAFGEDFIAPAAAEFMARYPDISIELDFSNRLVDLIAEGYDLAIRAGTLQDSSLIARRIGSRRLVTCASPDYLERCGVPGEVHELVNHNCLVGTLSTWRFREARKNFDLAVSGNWRSNNGRALTHAAIMGVGIVQLPDFYVREALNRGTLLPVLADCVATDAAVWAVYPHNRHLSAKVRMFVSHLAEVLPD